MPGNWNWEAVWLTWPIPWSFAVGLTPCTARTGWSMRRGLSGEPRQVAAAWPRRSSCARRRSQALHTLRGHKVARESAFRLESA
jgi:hypothetical protein